MSRIIHRTYEVIEEIGSGGGGIVYLAEHLNLRKKVVLKVDRRRNSKREDLLRREAEILKNLSHTYIPQVYDFFVEDGMVFTVIDYIEGESLEKPLKRGETFSQPQVIFWARQLLEALIYLHKIEHGNPPKGYVHGDIKPANIMRKPNGDICLIDYNIAMTFDEDQPRGYSVGYSSPEHYGIDYTSGGDDSVIRTSSISSLPYGSHPEDSISSRRKVFPDVRSDIYMVGATLYHLLGGSRPPMHAKDVEPLSREKFSPQLVNIIAKAMTPNPDLRYQTAEEMLEAFDRLYIDDPRIKQHQKRTRIGFAVLGCIMFLSALTSFTGMMRLRKIQQWEQNVIASTKALQNGNAVDAIQIAMKAVPEKSGLWTPEVLPSAQLALTDAMGVYDISSGFKVWKTLELPSQVQNMAISPDGTTALCMYENTIAVVDMNQGIITDTLSMENSALAEAKYLNEDTIIYAGTEGLTCYQISTKKILWTGKPTTGIAISANKNCVAGIDKEDTFATIYDAITGEIIRTIDFDGKHQFVTVNDSFVNPCDNLFALNADGSLLAVSFTDGSVILYETNSDRSASFPMESGTYCHFEGGFYQQCFAFCARTQEGKWTIEVIDMDTMTPIITKQSSAVHGVCTDEDGIFLIQDTNLTHIDEQTLQDGQYQLTTFPFAIRHFSGGNGIKLLSSESDICFYSLETGQSDMTACTERPDFLAVAGEKALVGSMDSNTIRLMQYRSFPEKQIFSYDKEISHMETRIAHHQETMMLYDDKSFNLVDKQGNLLKSGKFPDEKQVYDTQFIREENRSYLKVIYNDGKVIFYDADDGTMSEGQNDVIPDGSAYEEFETESYKITNSPHGSPEVYSRKTGKKLCDLQEDALLTDAQQIGDYLVLRYITANNLNTSLGTCYGVLLDRHFETVAHLPKLCDVINGQLVFDDPSGVISICPVYDIRTLCDEAQKGNLS